MAGTQRMTITEVAKAAGVGASTITSYASRGQMPAPSPCPCCGIGTTWARDEIDAWLAQRNTAREPAAAQT